MVNKNILGGWKYINETNGLLFDPAGSLSQIDNFVNDCRNGKFKDFIYKFFRILLSFIKHPMYLYRLIY